MRLQRPAPHVDARKKMKKESGKPLKIIQRIWKGKKD
jgi:hypothetical protein